MNKRYWMAYQAQRHGAKTRGIGWEITFEEWLAWWGDDIERRGTSPTSLQMQRIADSGPYAVGNIKKGVPKQNRMTAEIVRQNRLTAQAAIEHQRELDRLMTEESGESKTDIFDEDEKELFAMFYFKATCNFMA